MNRERMLERLHARVEPWDLVVVGGGATGLGVALDAAARGHEVALIEQSDLGKGTSSRSTKLVHGGVRYLQRGNISLVMGALHERGILRRNAPHLVHDLAFAVPNYDWWEAPFYGIGMKVYDFLAGRYGFGRSRLLSHAEIVERIPTIDQRGLRGGVLYYDGQFDDSRLSIDLAITAVEQGAVVANYIRATGLLKAAGGLVEGVLAHDEESGDDLELRARCVINAAGPWVDDLRRMDLRDVRPMIRPSQGVHIVLDRSFLPGETAIMVPHTEDGRVLFCIPWQDVVIVGTTDTPISSIDLEPHALPEETDFLLRTASRYLDPAPAPADVRSVFVGIRPLVDMGEGASTSALSRDHTIEIAKSGLLTIAGGKWTTYRRMAADVVEHATALAGLETRPCPTEDLRIHGHHEHAESFGDLCRYGSDAPRVQALIDSLPGGEERCHPQFTFRAGQVIWGVREEMARTVEDFLSRRVRALVKDARAAIAVAPRVALLMAVELGRDESWQARQVEEFTALARGYLL